MSESERPKIVFPCERYPIKVVARAQADIRERIDAVFARVFGVLPPGRVHERSSAQQNFVAITYEMDVDDVAQLSKLHGALMQETGIVMVL